MTTAFKSTSHQQETQGSQLENSYKEDNTKMFKEKFTSPNIW